jgi:hypothetical protein
MCQKALGEKKIKIIDKHFFFEEAIILNEIYNSG